MRYGASVLLASVGLVMKGCGMEVDSGVGDGVGGGVVVVLAGVC